MLLGANTGEEYDRVGWCKITRCTEKKGWASDEVKSKYDEMKLKQVEPNPESPDKVADEVLGPKSGLGYDPNPSSYRSNKSQSEETPKDSINCQNELLECLNDVAEELVEAQQAKLHAQETKSHDLERQMEEYKKMFQAMINFGILSQAF